MLSALQCSLPRCVLPGPGLLISAFLLAWILVLEGYGVSVIPLRFLTTAGFGFDQLGWCCAAVSQVFVSVLPVSAFHASASFWCGGSCGILLLWSSVGFILFRTPTGALLFFFELAVVLEGFSHAAASLLSPARILLCGAVVWNCWLGSAECVAHYLMPLASYAEFLVLCSSWFCMLALLTGQKTLQVSSVVL